MRSRSILVVAGIAGAIAACSNDFAIFEPRADGGTGPVTDSGGGGGPDVSVGTDGGGGTPDTGGPTDSGGGQDVVIITDSGCTVSQPCLNSATQCRTTCANTRATCDNACPNGNPGVTCRQNCKNQEDACKNNCEATCNTCTTTAGCSAPQACRSASQ